MSACFLTLLSTTTGSNFQRELCSNSTTLIYLASAWPLLTQYLSCPIEPLTMLASIESNSHRARTSRNFFHIARL